MAVVYKQFLIASIVVLTPSAVQGATFVKKERFETGPCSVAKSTDLFFPDTCDEKKFSYSCQSNTAVTTSEFSDKGCPGNASFTNTYPTGQCHNLDSGESVKYSCVNYDKYAVYATFNNADCTGGYMVAPAIFPENVCVKNAGSYYMYKSGQGIKSYSAADCTEGSDLEREIGSCFEYAGYAQKYNFFPPEDEPTTTTTPSAGGSGGSGGSGITSSGTATLTWSIAVLLAVFVAVVIS
eukprot:TRINITY_DN4502_c0_g1_i1.p1 TRINITY_DN4502_c0_g1~~TRINITY_DN4502_c0_g1_i1.p1  ORF type:complete len:238 (-),score=39.19 TRINITY_DN4502_c0_g1_i1:492-1205(-)